MDIAKRLMKCASVEAVHPNWVADFGPCSYLIIRAEWVKVFFSGSLHPFAVTQLSAQKLAIK